MVPFDNKLWRVFSNWDWVFRAQKSYPKITFLIASFWSLWRREGLTKPRSWIACSPINSIELSRLVYRSWIKMSETLGKESVKNGPNLSSSLAQVLMGDTSLSEAKYNYFRFLLYFTKYVFMCHYLSIFIHRWRYKSANLLWHWQWFTLRKLHYTNSTPQQALLYKFITI